MPQKWRLLLLGSLLISCACAAHGFNTAFPEIAAELKRASQEEWVAEITGDMSNFDASKAPLLEGDLPDENADSVMGGLPLYEKIKRRDEAKTLLNKRRETRPKVWHQLLEVQEGVEAQALARSRSESESLSTTTGKGHRWGLFGRKRSVAGTMVQTGSWYPRGGRTWKLSRGCGHRIASKRIKFQKRYLKAPAVMADLRALDVAFGRARKMNMFATGIDTSGFTAVIQTWGCTALNNAGLSWIAMGLDSYSYYRTKFVTRYTHHLSHEARRRRAEYYRNKKFLGILGKEMKFRSAHMAKENAKTLYMKRNFAKMLQDTHIKGVSKIQKTKEELQDMENMRKALQKKLRDLWAKHKAVLARIRYEVEEVRKVTHPVFLKRLDMLSKWQNNRYEEIAYEMNEMWHHTKTIRAKMFQRRRLLRAVIYHQRDVRRMMMQGQSVDKRIKCSCKDSSGSSSMGLAVDKECSCSGGDVTPQSKVFQPTIQIPQGA